MDNLLGLKDIEEAKSRIDSFVNETPIFSSSLLNKWLGHEIYFKAEGFQKIGAFKARGACNAISWLLENHQKPDRIIANSSGNHAQAIAWASESLGIKSSIFMPEFSSKVKIQATRSYGAEVILCKTRSEADEKVKSAADDNNTYWIPPFNHEQVILGQGTSAYEALTSLDDIDAVFAPCGGGGLLSGTLIAARGLNPRAEVIGAEPMNANDASISLQQGKIHRLTEKPDTLADGAMTMAIGDITFEYLKQLDDFIEISESEMIYWTQWLMHLLKTRIEPTCALAMEAAKKWLSGQNGKKKILVILSGGNMDQETATKVWKEDYLIHPPSL
ncbi:MAG: serine/threonine dehydratase [Bacteroidota bacterium]